MEHFKADFKQMPAKLVPVDASTPRPWRNIEHGIYQTENGKTIAFTKGKGIDGKEAIANASIIVKAVNGFDDLLKAAKHFLASAPSDCYDIGYQENRQALRRAIIKAEGAQ